jgi:hypothetical protein
LSAWSFAGRLRGRPGIPLGPTMGGMASTRGSSCVASWAFAGERWAASGTPFRSTTRWYLEPGLPRSVGLGPVCSPPLLARTLSESTLDRLQSMTASSPSQFSSVSCNRCQTPAACQSRSRRQQVVPLPPPSALGNSRHGQPVRRAKMMPPSTARSGTRGRPPFGFGGSFGNRGSMASHRASGTRIEASMATMMSLRPGFATRS